MNNPVAWQLWDAESIELARKYNRMIFLSIGYSACHCMSALTSDPNESVLAVTNGS